MGSGLLQPLVNGHGWGHGESRTRSEWIELLAEARLCQVIAGGDVSSRERRFLVNSGLSGYLVYFFKDGATFKC